MVTLDLLQLSQVLGLFGWPLHFHRILGYIQLIAQDVLGLKNGADEIAQSNTPRGDFAMLVKLPGDAPVELAVAGILEADGVQGSIGLVLCEVAVVVVAQLAELAQHLLVIAHYIILYF